MFANGIISAGVGIGINLLFSGASHVIDSVIHHDDNVIEKGQEAATTIQNQTDAYNEQKSSLEDLTTKYSELAKGVKISGNTIKNVSLTDDEYQEFLSTSNQIAESAPTLARTWDEEGNAILNAGTNTKELNTQVSDYLKLQRNFSYYTAKDNIDSQYEGYKTTLKDNESIIEKNQETYNKALSTSDTIEDFVKSVTKDKDEADETTGEFTYVISKDAYDKLGKYLDPDTLNSATPVGNQIEFRVNKENLGSLISDAKEAFSKAEGDAEEAKTNLINAKETVATEERSMLSSIRSMASTIDSFDDWEDQDKASTFQSQLDSMLGSVNRKELLNNYKKSGKDMDTWLRSNIVNPMALASENDQNLWQQLFELSPKENETVYQFRNRRDNILDQIAQISDDDFWTKNTLAEAFGFAHTEYDDQGNASLVWENQSKLDRIKEVLENAEASKTKGDASDVREDFNKNMSPDDLELAVQVITDDNAIKTIDDFYKAFNKAKREAESLEAASEVSLDSMETKVETAKTNLSSISTILTETVSSGGVSKDNINSLYTIFNGVEDPNEEEVNLNRLFTTTSDGVKLNVDTLKDYATYQQDAIDKKFEEGISYQTKAIKDQEDAWKDAKDALDEYSKGKDKDTINASDEKAAFDEADEALKNLRDDYISYMQSQSEWQATKKEQKELLSYYSQWQTAQSTENAGDKYNNILSGLETAKEAYDNGLVGTDDFKTFAALISPTGSDDRKNFAENYSKAKRYLTENKTGVNNFLNDLKSKGMASYNKSTKRWSFDIDDMDEAARSLGISTEFMNANFGRLRDYGIDNNFISSTEEGISRVKELSLALAEEQERLKNLEENDKTNTTAIRASQNKIKEYKENLQETTENLSTYYEEDYTEQAKSDFEGAAIAVQQLDKSINKVKKDSSLTSAEKKSMISKMEAEQAELAAQQYSTIDDLRDHDVYSLVKGMDPDVDAKVAAVKKINKAYKEQNTEVTSLVGTLSKYSQEQLESIDFNDGKWDEGLGDAEKAVESLCEKFELTKDQAQVVIEALSETGKLKGSIKIDSTIEGTWNKPLSAEQMGIKDSDAISEYENAIKAVTKAHQENNVATESSLKTLSEYNREQLNGIKLGDGVYNVKGMEKAEDALEQLTKKTELSKEELITALEGLGVLDYQITNENASKSLDETVSKAKEAQEELSEITGKEYQFDFDTDNLETVRKQISDLETEIDKYRDRDGKFHSEIAGGEQLQTMYSSGIKKEQEIEYSSSDVSQYSSSSNIVKAAQDFMQAKNEMDIQTQLYQKGMENTLEDATQNANTAFKTLQQMQDDSGVKLIDTDNIQAAEDQLLLLTNDDIESKIDVKIDESDYESVIKEAQDGGEIELSFSVDSDISNLSIDELTSQIEELEDKKIEIEAKFGVDSSEYKAIESMIEDREVQKRVQILLDQNTDIDQLLALEDEDLALVANIDINTEDGQAKLESLKQTLQSLADTSVDATVKLDETQFNALVGSQETATITVDADNEPAKNKIDEAVDYGNSAEATMTIDGDPGPAKAAANSAKAYAEGLHPVISISGDASGVKSAIGSALTGPFSITVSANVVGMPSNAADAAGTMTSIARADGTAYNVLNMKPLSPAHAKGDVALKHNEQALVNEEGMNGHSESIVRNGVWSLIPGGAHFENLRKGDIIFSAKQTDDLLKHGATPGHARTYAQGSMPGIQLSSAYAYTENSNNNLYNSNKNSDSTYAQESTDAINENTTSNNNLSNTVSEASDALDDAIEKLNENAVDWIETALDRLDRKTEDHTNIAESDRSHYKKARKYYNLAIKDTEKEISAAKQAMAGYLAYANKVASNATIKQYLTPALITKIQNGTLAVESLSEEQKKAVDAYKTWYDKYLEAKDTYEEKTEQKLDLAQGKVENVYNSYEIVIGKREALEGYYNALAENRILHGKNQKEGTTYWKQLEKQKYYAEEQKRLTGNELKEVKKRMADYLKANGNNVKDKAYQEMKKEYYELKTTYVEADTHIQELTQKLEETRQAIIDWKVNRWDRAGSLQDAAINYREVSDNPNLKITEATYTERIKTNNREIKALQEAYDNMYTDYQRNFSSFNNEEAQEKLEQLNEYKTKILELASANEEYKNSIMEIRWEPFYEVQDKLSNAIKEYETAQKLLGDTDTFYNDDGSFSVNGLANILLTQEAIDATKDKIANYQKGLELLDEQYKNGNWSLKEYKEKQQELLQSLQQESTTLANLKQNMLDMYQTQITKENNLLQDNIDKRKEALDAKEEYYDYDRTLKKKSKDINALKAQIAALEGTTNAASKARLEKLKAELAEAEDDMANTMHQHEVDMKNTGYENLSDEANKALDNTLDAVKKNSAFQEAIIGNMLDNVTLDYESTYKHLGTVLDDYGLKTSETFKKNISDAADFNRELGKIAESINKIDTSKINSVSNGGGTSAPENIATGAESSNGAGQNPTLYTFKIKGKPLYMMVGDKIKKTVVWSPSNPSVTTLEWSSSDTSVCTVDKNGKVTAKKKGKATIKAKSTEYSSASDTCSVYIIPKEYQDGISAIETSYGKSLTDEQKQEVYKNIYKNTYDNANGVNQIMPDGGSPDKTWIEATNNTAAVLLKDWFDALPDRPEGTGDIPSGTSALASYFMQKGKKVDRYDLQNLANILQIETPGATNYESWGSALKNKILKSYKKYGFSKGGIVRSGIPATVLDILGKDALIPQGDSVLIGANPGETVLTEEFTKQLRPTVATLSEFNKRIFQSTASTLPLSQTGETNMNNEYNFTINVDSISGEQDIKKLAYKISDIITERNKRDWKKIR